MSDRPRVTGQQAKRAFERAGFVEVRVNGAHHVLKKEGRRYRLSIPIHKGKTLGVGLLSSLIKDAGLTDDEFYELL